MGKGVKVGGTAVAVGGSGVTVAGSGVAVGGSGVGVRGNGVTVGGTGVAIAKWDETMLDGAKVEAEGVIRKLRSKDYLSIADPPPKHSEDLAAICLDNVLGWARSGDEGEGGRE